MRRFCRRGILGVLGLVVGAVLWARTGLYPLLARQSPVPAEILVVEGWLEDELLRQAAGSAESNGVRRLVATGGPIALGGWLSDWGTYAELTKARLEKLGLADRFEIVAALAGKVRRGRTQESARALRAAIHLERGAFNLASEGPHTRRSWRAFRREFGAGVVVGSLALTPVEYGPDDWGRCSEGARAVLAETIAFIYDLCVPE